MKNKLLKIRVSIENTNMRLRKNTKKYLGNNRGSGFIEVILIAALIILAVFAIKPSLLGTFMDLATSFRTWMNLKAQEFFQ